jgi:hypothetical protein
MSLLGEEAAPALAAGTRVGERYAAHRRSRRPQRLALRRAGSGGNRVHPAYDADRPAARAGGPRGVLQLIDRRDADGYGAIDLERVELFTEIAIAALPSA